MEITMQESLYIYYGVFLFSICMSFIYQRNYQEKKDVKLKKGVLIFLIIAPVVLMQTLRYKVGTDYYPYEVLYREIIKGSHNVVYQKYSNEYFYVLECIISDKLVGDVWGFFFINAFIENTLVFVLLDYYKKKIDMPLAYTIFYFMFYPMFLNAERQSVAMTIVWVGIILLEKRKFIGYFILVAIAIMFHNSAIIYAGVGVIYLFDSILNYIKKYSGIFISLFIAGVLISYWYGYVIMSFILNNFSFLGKYKRYLIDDKSKISLAYIVVLLLMVPCIIYLKNIEKNEMYNKVYIIGFVLQIVLLMVSLAGQFGNRLFAYFYNVEIISIAMLKQSISKTNRKYITTSYSISAMIYFYILYFYIGNSQIFPYRMITEKFIKWH
ncbi:EpsG family protein [Lachnobacterium bovis]|uniref:EpsG family protein n=1 Tax=Lachnobacterium bovis TaxID=140626 RepID=A0A1H9PH64_9FIRM|nr:EpsG family protein [Lachnobacterium bovis]SER46903.1 EpsG family protein [Lachnobacterium bovis]